LEGNWLVTISLMRLSYCGGLLVLNGNMKARVSQVLVLSFFLLGEVARSGLASTNYAAKSRHESGQLVSISLLLYYHETK